MAARQVFLGQGLHQLDELLPANSLPLDDIFAAGLLIFFGVKTLLVRPPTLAPRSFLRRCWWARPRPWKPQALRDAPRCWGGDPICSPLRALAWCPTNPKTLQRRGAGRERRRRERRGREGRGREGSGAHGQWCKPASAACKHAHCGAASWACFVAQLSRGSPAVAAAEQSDCVCRP